MWPPWAPPGAVAEAVAEVEEVAEDVLRVQEEEVTYMPCKGAWPLEEEPVLTVGKWVIWLGIAPSPLPNRDAGVVTSPGM